MNLFFFLFQANHEFESADDEVSRETEMESEEGPSTPSFKRKKKFSCKEVQLLKQCCASIIKGATLSQDSVWKAVEGTVLAKNYTYQQLSARLTYERRKLQQSKGKEKRKKMKKKQKI